MQDPSQVLLLLQKQKKHAELQKKKMELAQKIKEAKEAKAKKDTK